MAMDRNQLEREALNLINKGQLDKALNAYLSILRVDPRDRRIKQKAAELLLRMGRPVEAVRFLREVAEGLVADGQPRPAIAVWKQLLELNPGDADIEGQLGACYHAGGFVPDARKHYEDAIRKLARTYPDRAIHYARQLVRIAPGEAPPQIQLAELLESGGKPGEAFEAWKNLAAEARKRGRLDEVARFLELALKGRPDDLETLCEAAEARISNGDPRPALVHLQRAHGLDRTAPRIAALLARAFESAGLTDKARPAWMHAARLYEEEGDVVARLDALQRAVAAGEDSPEVLATLGDAARAAERFQLRLDDKPWAQPRSDAEVRVFVRARTLARYGFQDRARALLTAAEPVVRNTLSIRVALAELLSEAGDPAGALAELREAPSPAEPEARGQLDTRIEVLAMQAGEIDDLGHDALEELPEELDGPALSPVSEGSDDEPVDDEPTEDEAPRWDSPITQLAPPKGLAVAKVKLDPRATRAERAAAPRTAPPLPVAPAAPAAPSPAPLRPARGALIDDEPTDHGSEPFSLGLDDARSFLDGASEMPDFGDVFGGGPAERGPLDDIPTNLPGDDPALAEARALLAIGRYSAVKAKLDGRADLLSALVVARAQLESGDSGGAGRTLQDALDEAAERDAGYLDALYWMARLHAINGKYKSAVRALTELDDLDPMWRADDVADLRRGVDLAQRG